MITFLVAASCLIHGLWGQGERNETELLDRWSASIDSIWSYDVFITIKVDAYSRKQKKLVRATEATLRQRFLRGRWRVDVLKTRITVGGKVDEWEGEGDDIKSFAYDGEESVRYFHASDLFGQVDPRAEFSKTRLLAPLWHEVFHTDYSGEPWPTLLTDRAVLSTAETATGQLAMRFGSTDKPMSHSKATNQISVLLDPVAGYLPASIVFGENLEKRDGFRTEVTNEFSFFKATYWIPKTSTWIDFAPSITGSADQPAMVTEMQVDLDRTLLNVEIDPAVFAMAFPPGSIVYESESQTNFVQREGDSKDYEAAAEFARERLEAAKSSGGATGRMRWVWLAILNAAVLGGLILFAVRKRRK